MTALSPYVHADGEVRLVPRCLHNAGTGVDELGDLVLNTRDVTRASELVKNGLMHWWGEVAGVDAAHVGSTDEAWEEELLLALFRTIVLPAAAHVESDGYRKRALKDASGLTPEEIPAVDVLIHPDAVARLLHDVTRAS